MDLAPIVAQELVRELEKTRGSDRGATRRFGRAERLIARGEDLFLAAPALPGHECVFGRLRIDPGGWVEIECRPRPVFMGRQRLADPRCFSRLAASVEDGVDRWIRGLYHDFESTTDSFEVQRLTALKAFSLAFEASQRGQRPELVKDLEEIIELLEIEEPEKPSTIRRQVLYRLALATCRLHDPALVVKAAHYGVKFRQFGSFSPIHSWRKIIEAVCRAAREHKMFHRGRQRLRLPFGHNEEEAEYLRKAAEVAASVSKQTIEKFAPFLRLGTLQDLARYHQIY